MPGIVSPELDASSAIPKSAIFTSPRRPSRRFGGFMSRCTVPPMWISSSPRSVSSATIAAMRQGSRSFSFSTAPRSTPSTYSWAMYWSFPVREAVVDGHDVVVVDARGGARFAFEAAGEVGLLGQVAPDLLEDDVAIERRLSGAQDDAHAPLGELLLDDIVAEGLRAFLRHRFVTRPGSSSTRRPRSSARDRAAPGGIGTRALRLPGGHRS